MKMNLNYIHRRRVFRNSLVIATTLITCSALQANDHEDASKSTAIPPASTSQQAQTGENPSGGNVSSSSQNNSIQSSTSYDASGAPASAQTDRSADKNHSPAQKFIKEAAQSGKMEVQMGQLGQQQGQNQEVKRLGEALVRDHTMANQRLQQIAQQQGVQISDSADKHGDKHGDKHQKQQQHLTKLQGQSGAEFDKEFVRMALKHHKKDIAKFEKAQNEVSDPQLKAFIQETLPKLRQHLQMAQTAARSVGVDESTIAADQDDDATSGVGGAAGSVSGDAQIQKDRPQSSIDLDRGNDRLDGSIQSDASLNVDQNSGAIQTPSASADVDADVDRSDNSASIEADADVDDGGIFEKGDGKVLGLSTDKQDGKFLGVIPNPRANNDDADADVSVEADVDTETESVGSPGSTTTDSDSSTSNPKR